MARNYHYKGEALRRTRLRQENASEIRHGRVPLVISAPERKEGKGGK